MPWERPAISEDPDEVIQSILDGLGDRLPGWEPVDGAVEVAVAEELGYEWPVRYAITKD